ncbi:hypothetical protein DRH27_05625 [Candidatus Falkowbacteria bacterium]|nr:MAG: hypothetical protein DRH27_05625 [Candidatus Falkowbacteria bacterium]
MPEDKLKKSNTVEEGKVCAILAYLLIGIIWYFADDKMRKNDFAGFHVKQALILIIISFAGSIALSMTFVLVWLIPLYQLVVFVFVVMGIINAYNGQKKELPIIGQFGKKFKF